MRFGYVTGITFDSADNLIYSDQALGRVRRMNFTTNVVETIAGNSPGTIGEDGPALGAALNFHNGADVGMTSSGDLLIADARVRRLARGGTLTTIAGNGGPVSGYENYLKGTYCGDGGPALTACLNTPYGLAFDADENLFVSDHGNNRIRKIDRNGIITTFVQIASVTTIRFDRNGYLYASPRERIVRFDRAGNMTTIAGVRDTPGFSGDGGPALSARLDTKFGQSRGFAFNDQGDLFFVDFSNRRVRAVRGGAR